jgi:choline dehydrogenase-like flavoprotein
LDHWRTVHAVGGFTSADLQPHFAAVEDRLSVAEIPLEESNPNNRLLYQGCKALGLEAKPTRRNVKRCMKSGYCGMGCPVDAKQSMLITYLPDAVQKGAQVLYRLRVEKLVLEGGRVVRAEAAVLDEEAKRPTGKRVAISAQRFVVACGAVNSPALLLRSGLGAASSPLGRRTFLHPTVGTTALHKDAVEPYYGAPQSIASHALAHRGDKCGLFLEAAPMHPMLLSLVTSGIGAEHRARMLELPRLSTHIALAIDGFGAPDDDPGGVVTVRPSGMPACDYPLKPRIWEALRTALETLAKIDLASGAEVVRTSHDPSLEIRSQADLAKLADAPMEPGRISVFSAHVMGGCAMGDDPARAVVRSSDLRHHTVENLHVIDGSVLPTALGVNPQETIYGLAHLMASRLHAGWT